MAVKAASAPNGTIVPGVTTALGEAGSAFLELPGDTGPDSPPGVNAVVVALPSEVWVVAAVAVVLFGASNGATVIPAPVEGAVEGGTTVLETVGTVAAVVPVVVPVVVSVVAVWLLAAPMVAAWVVVVWFVVVPIVAPVPPVQLL